MSGSMQTITVSVFGETYTLRSDEGSDVVIASAAYVDGVMRELAQKMHSSDHKLIAVLTALKLAHQLKALEMHQQVQGARIIELLDRELAAVSTE